MTIFALLLLCQIGQQQVIWIGDSTTNSLLRPVTAQAVVFYDESNNVRLIILNPTGPGPSPPGPNPNPLPPGPSPGPGPPQGKYNVSPVTYMNVNNYLKSGKVTKDQTAALAKAYRQVSDNINATIAGVGGMSRIDAQNLLINKTHETLGNNLAAWAPILDTLVAHMKSISSKLPTSKELAEYYLEVAIGLEACN